MRLAVLTLLILCLTSSIFALYSPKDDVILLNDSNFDRQVLQSDDVWIVEFYADYCGHCKSLAPTYKQVASALKNIVKVAAIDMMANRSIGEKYQIQGFPTIKIFGADKKNPIEYSGERTTKAIASAGLKAIRETVLARIDGPKRASSSGPSSSSSSSTNGKGGVIQLDPSSFNTLVKKSTAEHWLVSFTSPQCGHCVRMKPDFEAAAREFPPSGKIRFGNVDCTVHQSLCSQYGVRGYPTFKYFAPGTTTPQDYNSGRSKSDFVTFMKSKNIVSSKPTELTSQGQLDECKEATVCVVAVLPDIRDSSVQERKRYIDVIKDAAEKSKLYNAAFVYTYALTHRNLETALEIGNNGYPSLSIYNARRSAYAPLYRAFTVNNISDLVGNVALGREHLFDLKTKITPLETVHKWDGKEAPRDEL